MSEKILEVKNLTKYFGGVRALEDVTLHVKRGALVGLIGPNGSGKTTLFNVITGFYPPDRGEVYFKGKRIDGLNPNEVFKMGLVRTFQNPRLFFQMSVWENMLVIPQEQKGESILWAPFRKAWETEEMKIGEKAKSLLDNFGLFRYAVNKASDLSGAHIKMLESARGLMGKGEMFLLDEPAAGVAHADAHKIFSFIRRLRDEYSLTFFIIEHRIEVLMDYVEYVYVLHNGRLLSQGTPEEVLNDPKVIQAYIGE